jgi:hypothetical protein
MRATLVIVLAFAHAAAQAAVAQSAPAPSAVSDSTLPAAAPQKKGMFGKIKGLAKNKVVKTVAKAALCTAVPGGQVIAGALDAAETKNVAGAAGAAAGLAGGGGNCMPGMGLAGNAVTAATGGAGVAGAVAGAGIPSMPTTGLGGAGMSAEQLKLMQEQYQKMGMDPAQIKAMQQMMMTPGAGMSPAQIKQMQEQYRKMGMDPAQIQAMQQQMMAGTPGAAAAPAAEATQPDSSAH